MKKTKDQSGKNKRRSSKAIDELISTVKAAERAGVFKGEWANIIDRELAALGESQ